MIFLKSILTVFTVLLISCCSSTKITTIEADNSKDNAMEATKMMKAGFKKGVIVASKVEGDCPYVIEIKDDTSYLLDPINMTDEYKKDGEKVWVKYSGLKMMNRCEKANPISIMEISKRAE